MWLLSWGDRKTVRVVSSGPGPAAAVRQATLIQKVAGGVRRTPPRYGGRHKGATVQALTHRYVDGRSVGNPKIMLLPKLDGPAPAAAKVLTSIGFRGDCERFKETAGAIADRIAPLFE